MNKHDANKLSLGVKDLVLWLNDQGFNTCDSGDGTNFAAGMGCAVPFPMVAIEVPPDKMHAEADRLKRVLTERGVDFTPPKDEASEDVQFPTIEASYNPQDGYSVIVLYNILSKHIGL